MKKDLNTKFEEAVELALSTEEKLPPDIMLQFYAYYKQATKGSNYGGHSANDDLRNAFKLNAWFQLNHLSEEKAKKEYIKLVKKYLK